MRHAESVTQQRHFQTEMIKAAVTPPEQEGHFRKVTVHAKLIL